MSTVVNQKTNTKQIKEFSRTNQGQLSTFLNHFKELYMNSELSICEMAL